MDLTRCLLHLVPGAKFGVIDNDYARIEWKDERPLPTLAQCEAAWPEVQALEAASAAAQQAADANESTLRSRAETALADLRAYRDLQSPTNAQTVAVVRLLCRVAIGLIRLALRRFDGLD